MNEITEYVRDVIDGVKSLVRGMKVTGHYVTHPSEIVTQQYPENRLSLKMFERFRGEVVMIHDQNNQHRCTGCSACELACPNGTIRIISDHILLENNKKQKIIDTFVYNLAMCTFCNLCIRACPTDAIVMDQTFEHAVTDRTQLIKILNRPGSSIMSGVEEKATD